MRSLLAAALIIWSFQIGATENPCESALVNDLAKLVKLAVVQRLHTPEQIQQWISQPAPTPLDIRQSLSTDQVAIVQALRKRTTDISTAQWAQLQLQITADLNQQAAEVSAREESRQETNAIIRPKLLHQVNSPDSFRDAGWTLDAQGNPTIFISSQNEISVYAYQCESGCFAKLKSFPFLPHTSPTASWLRSPDGSLRLGVYSSNWGGCGGRLSILPISNSSEAPFEEVLVQKDVSRVQGVGQQLFLQSSGPKIFKFDELVFLTPARSNLRSSDRLTVMENNNPYGLLRTSDGRTLYAGIEAKEEKLSIGVWSFTKTGWQRIYRQAFERSAPGKDRPILVGLFETREREILMTVAQGKKILLLKPFDSEFSTLKFKIEHFAEWGTAPELTQTQDGRFFMAVTGIGYKKSGYTSTFSVFEPFQSRRPVFQKLDSRETQGEGLSWLMDPRGQPVLSVLKAHRWTIVDPFTGMGLVIQTPTEVFQSRQLRFGDNFFVALLGREQAYIYKLVSEGGK